LRAVETVYSEDVPDDVVVGALGVVVAVELAGAPVVDDAAASVFAGVDDSDLVPRLSFL
jgi:hypothetical protein